MLENAVIFLNPFSMSKHGFCLFLALQRKITALQGFSYVDLPELL